MKRVLLPLIAGVVLVGTFVLVPAVRARIDRIVFLDDVTLGEGVANAITLVQQTADATDTHLTFAPEPDSANPEQADELRNNYSASDHSDQRRYPGYNDCDHIRNVFDDGWEARYAVEADYSDASHDREATLALVRDYWESHGYEVHTSSEQQGSYTYQRLWIDTDFGVVQFNIDPRRATASIQGITDCLPPSCVARAAGSGSALDAHLFGECPYPNAGRLNGASS